MLPSIPCNRDGVSLLVDIVEKEDAGMLTNIRCIEERRGTLVRKHAVDNDLIGIGYHPDHDVVSYDLWSSKCEGICHRYDILVCQSERT